MWRVARRTFADHQPDADGFCQTCRPHQSHPCDSRRLAVLALRTACLPPWRPLGIAPRDPRERLRWLATTPMVRPALPETYELRAERTDGPDGPDGSDGSLVDGCDERSE